MFIMLRTVMLGLREHLAMEDAQQMFRAALGGPCTITTTLILVPLYSGISGEDG